MGAGKKKSLGAQLASLLDPTPRDVDPEEFGETFRNRSAARNGDASDSNSDIDDNAAATEHYVDVGRSKMRRNAEFLVDDPKYAGKQRSRANLYDSDDDMSASVASDSDVSDDDDDDDDDSNDDSSEEEELMEMRKKTIDKPGKRTDRVEHHSSPTDSDAYVTADEEVGDQESEEESDDDSGDGADHLAVEQDEAMNDELRAIESEERQLLRTVSQGAKSDVSKGIDVRHQLTLWDTLLDARIRLQKSVTLANQLPQASTIYFVDMSDFDSFADGAEDALARTRRQVHGLLDSLLDLRVTMLEHNTMHDMQLDELRQRKRPHQDDEEDSDESDEETVWHDMQRFSTAFQPFADETLEKWSGKVQMAAGIPINKKFKAINQGARAQIEQILADKERLVKRTQLKRTDYQIIGKTTPSELKAEEPAITQDAAKNPLDNHDTEVFDDTDFYQQLLRELIESRMVDTDDPLALGVRWAALKQQTKQNKKKVDRKASKGRRLRYHVHEKLQNFMVPIPTGSWHESMVEELYTSLLGRQAGTDQSGAADAGQPAAAHAEQDEMGGLRIFG
ncbi:apoptosis-antagonizing transcription factor [Thamnocephalis sphaerospora]|uniref:Protein BFR2 n=1 Tax=Thamnocephalis sphaerospora TaxID=78915 RepID=A0A4P9XNZ2_9FUNG|nr:apoptosis-antagonizing transcription factor [Thamnocephalis sphaerospora]|eukprot:RKP07141.1 apoptosis-antagonizing transcription factor [Thamnocephalis sphaerospora]